MGVNFQNNVFCFARIICAYLAHGTEYWWPLPHAFNPLWKWSWLLWGAVVEVVALGRGYGSSWFSSYATDGPNRSSSLSGYTVFPIAAMSRSMMVALSSYCVIFAKPHKLKNIFYLYFLIDRESVRQAARTTTTEEREGLNGSLTQGRILGSFSTRHFLIKFTFTARDTSLQSSCCTSPSGRLFLAVGF